MRISLFFISITEGEKLFNKNSSEILLKIAKMNYLIKKELNLKCIHGTLIS